MKLLALWIKHRCGKRRRDLLSAIAGEIRQNRDLMTPEEVGRLEKFADEVRSGSDSPEQIASLEKKFGELAGKNGFAATMRSLLDVILVAVTVAFGIRALFLQPFQIPTGSMQPTLFGVHYIDRKESASLTGPLTKLYLNTLGEKVKFVAENGVAPEDPSGNIYRYLDQSPERHSYPPGTVICDGWLSSGDHLFVDRLSLHFAPLKRGEIFIFNTEGIRDVRTHRPLTGFFYVKRMVGMPGDTLKIDSSDHLWIRPKGEAKFRPATDFSPRFDKIYSGRGGYHGHIAHGLLANGKEYTVPDNCYFALGDNSRGSLDSRYWGCVPRRNVIGRALNVFWPVSRRWGLIDTLEPLDVPNETPNSERPDSQMPAMRLQ